MQLHNSSVRGRKGGEELILGFFNPLEPLGRLGSTSSREREEWRRLGQHWSQQWLSVNTEDAYEVINTACRNIQSESDILMRVYLSRR